VPMGTFQTAGNEYINIAASTQRLFPRFCEVADLQELVADRRFSSVAGRRQNAAELRSIIGARLKERSAQEWIERLNAAGVPCGPVLNIKEVFDDPQVKHLRAIQPVRHPIMGEINLIASPIDIQGASKELERPCPGIGEHSKTILFELGYNESEIQKLYEQGIISTE
jgi:crotonobetainyl-CoA:carnitine CoA-transferase CaiB-like acyl-CoA transferase